MLAPRPDLDPGHDARRPRRPRARRHQSRAGRTNKTARHRRLQGRRQSHRRAPRREFQGAVTLSVVPANAGTHTPRPAEKAQGKTASFTNQHSWLWVPAFAGTTIDLRTSPRRRVVTLVSR